MIDRAKFEPFSFHCFETVFLTHYKKLSGEMKTTRVSPLKLISVSQSPTTFRPMAVGHRIRYTHVMNSGLQEIIHPRNIQDQVRGPADP